MPSPPCRSQSLFTKKSKGNASKKTTRTREKLGDRASTWSKTVTPQSWSLCAHRALLGSSSEPGSSSEVSGE